ncbi:conserved hypothetical protein [Flavobacterium psychrophilum]|uniref:DUF2586 family protein n=1 Tax=Flavobacterium psychrophilum TaxID=96345 RepID=UPI000B7C1A24|nr:DUF2586 family protein [Flavobacterium psychrophilum]SNA83368.1 conserved hypothetical protein [Flavobacterium psychrophilum]
MANLNGVFIKKGRLGANTLTKNDGVSALIIGCPATTQLVHGIVKTLYNSVDVVNAGFTATSDSTSVNAYRHLLEFYRTAGEGQKLQLMIVPQDTTITEILENEIYAKKLIIASGGEVRQLGIAVNPTIPSVYLDGLPQDVYQSIAKAQNFHNWSFDNHFPCQILLEGYDLNGSASAVANLRSLPNISAPKVSVIIGQDYNHAETKTGNARKFADVGTALGTLSACTIEQNIGDNEAFNLTDATKNTWLVPGLSSHKMNDDVYSDLQTLENKGYIFGFIYAGMQGVRWNNDHTCVEIIQDSEGNINEHTIAYGRTHDKALRLLRTALLPKVKKTYPVDPANGQLPIGVQKYFEGIGNEVFEGMRKRKEISSGRMFVDATSDLITEKVLKTTFKLVPYGTIGEITGTSNLKTSL